MILMSKIPSQLCLVVLLPLIITLLNPASIAASQTPPSSESDIEWISAEEFFISGVTVGTTADDVKSLLGNPLSITSRNFLCDVWAYPQTRICLENNRVFGMSTTAPNMCTPSNVCVGDPIDKVFRILGKTTLSPARSDKPKRLEYLARDTIACWLELFVNDEFVTELRLACQP